MPYTSKQAGECAVKVNIYTHLLIQYSLQALLIIHM